MAAAALRLLAMLATMCFFVVVGGVGINWGTASSHLLPHRTIVAAIQRSGFTKVKLFDADPGVVRAFAGTELEVMVAVPNDMLEDMAFSLRGAERWLRNNVSRHLSHKDHGNGVNIRYIAVGNEPFLKAYNGSFVNVTLPAMRNVQKAIDAAGLSTTIKVVVPMNADILTSIGASGKPSQGVFRPDIRSLMANIAQFLNDHHSPFVINMYPFLSLQQDKDFPRSFAFFDETGSAVIDGNRSYTNVFDASFDLLVSALEREGFPQMPIVIGEVGWPTDGDPNANIYNAKKFIQQLLRHLSSGRGTPLRPGITTDVYLFSFIDEDQKSVLPGSFERHWGLYQYDGRPKYDLKLGSINLTSIPSVKYLSPKWCILNPDLEVQPGRLATAVNYACSYADCSPLVNGGSCNHIGKIGNASFAFNSYYQINNQNDVSCDFKGLAVVTKTNPSVGNCQFNVQITPWDGGSMKLQSPVTMMILAVSLLLILI